jgi:hypothetical protein
MIEPLLIEWPQLGVRTVVLNVARDAVGCNAAVNALLLRDPLRDWLMAHEAFRCGHLLACGVTLQTVGDAFERGVGARQPPWRYQRAKLGGCRARRCQEVQRGHQNHPPVSNRE